jgi:hypothetical protein
MMFFCSEGYQVEALDLPMTFMESKFALFLSSQHATTSCLILDFLFSFWRTEGGDWREGGEWEPNQFLLQEPAYVSSLILKAKTLQ